MADDTDAESIFATRTLAVWAAVLITGLSMASTAWAESGSVRYSYEEVEVGAESQYVLVPHRAPNLRGDLGAASIHGAFNLLKDKKGNSYGETSIKVEGQAPEDAKVIVDIDPDYARYKLIIIAETVYTLSEMGVDDIRFPGHAQGNVKRKDVPFAAYTLTVPLWRALPPNDLVDARVRMPDGTLLDIADVYRRWENGDDALKKALFSYLDEKVTYTVVSVLKRLPKLEVDYAEEVAGLVRRDSRAVRSAALSALEKFRNDAEVLEAVVLMMNEDEDKELARRAAEFLGEAKSKKFSVQEHFFLLKRGSDNEKVAAAEALGEYDGDERVVTHLVEALEADAQKLAAAAATSLVDVKAYDALGKALERKAVAAEIRMQIAEALADEDDAGARIDGLRYQAANKRGRPGRVALKTLAEVETTAARKAVESFLDVEDRQLRETAVDTLVEIGAIESLPAIAAAVRNVEDSAALEQGGYEILNSKPESVVLQKAESDDKIIRRIAYRSLGAKAAQGGASDEVISTLKEGADSSDPLIRGAAARGLGDVGGKEALEVLRKLGDDEAATVRRDVAYALANYEEGQMHDLLVRYLSDESPEVKAAALDTFARRGDSSVWVNDELRDKIKALANAEDPAVRKEAYQAAGALVPLDKKQAVREVIGMLSGAVTSDDSDRVIRAALRSLGRFEKARAVNGIAIMLNAKKREMRLTSIRALAATGHKSAADLLVDTLADPDPEIRRAAVLALGELGAKSARPRLEQRLKQEKDPEVKKVIEETLNSL